MKKVIEIVATIFLCSIVFIILADLGILPEWIGRFFTGSWLIFYLVGTLFVIAVMVRFGVKSVIRRFSREKDLHTAP